MKSPLSLTARISLLFALSSAAVLLLAGLLFAHAGANQFLERDTTELSGKLTFIQNALTASASPETASSLPAKLKDITLGHPGIAVLVTDVGQRQLFAVGPQAVIRHLESGRELDALQPILWQSADRVYRIVGRRLPLSSAGYANVEVALDVTNNQHFLAYFRQFLWFGIVLAMLAMGGLGWGSVRRGLVPLNALSERMSSISAQQLNTAIPLVGAPEELQALISSFNLMLQRLHESFERLSAFSSDIAHELRTPLNNLITQNQVMLRGQRDNEAYRETLVSNMEEFERLAHMVNDMLFLAQADNQQIVLKWEWFDLRLEVERVCDFYEAATSERGIHFSLQGHATLHADKGMLQRVLLNLISNAVRHTGDDQTVGIVLSETDKASMLVICNPGNDIPADKLERIFDRFYRLDSARRESESGHVGLGLAIVHSILTLHGGKVWAESAQGETRFCLLMPK